MRFVAATVLFLLSAAAPVPAQQSRSDTLLTVDHLLDMEQVADPRLSPDGREIVYTRRHVNQLEDRWDAELWITNADGSRNRFLTRGSSPRWSPDGTRIAFIAPGDPTGPQIFVRWMDAEGATSQVTRVDHAPGSPAWSPDGTRLAFVMLVPHREPWAIAMPTPPQGASWTAPPRMVTSTHYRQDRRGFAEEGFTHVFVVPADGGTARQITHGEWNVGARFSGITFGADIAWTPDGREIVFDGIVGDDGDNRYNEAYIHAVDVATGSIRQIVSDKGYWTSPVVSPDGSRVAFTGYDYTEQTYHTSELYVADLDGGNMHKLSGDLDRDVGPHFWSADSRQIYFTAGDHGTQNAYRITRNGQVQPVTAGNHMLTLSTLTPDGAAVGLVTSPQAPPDVYRIDLRNGGLTQLTHVNDDLLAGKRLATVEEIQYASGDGTPIQGWIVTPPGFDPSQRYPLILHIHGGPHAMYNVGFSFPYQNYAANGYVVLYTNPRGSTGYGTDFGNAIDDGYPGVDYDDLMAGVDAVEARGYIDPDRTYVTGCSGGGVLSSWTIGHTDRFAAAAVRCPVIDWISFAGTTDIVQWGFHRFRGYFWDNPTKWLEHSPLMYVGHVTTPVLLMTGVLDLRTPISQTEEYYAALKVRGVPTVMLRFNREYHGTSSVPSNAMRTQLYIMDWFRQHRKNTSVSDGIR